MSERERKGGGGWFVSPLLGTGRVVAWRDEATQPKVCNCATCNGLLGRHMDIEVGEISVRLLDSS